VNKITVRVKKEKENVKQKHHTKER